MTVAELIAKLVVIVFLALLLSACAHASPCLLQCPYVGVDTLSSMQRHFLRGRNPNDLTVDELLIYSDMVHAEQQLTEDCHNRQIQ